MLRLDRTLASPFVTRAVVSSTWPRTKFTSSRPDRFRERRAARCAARSVAPGGPAWYRLPEKLERRFVLFRHPGQVDGFHDVHVVSLTAGVLFFGVNLRHQPGMAFDQLVSGHLLG